MVMLSMVLECAVCFAVITLAVGATVGMTAKRLGWSAKRTYMVANFGFYVPLFVIAYVVEVLFHLDLPWPPRVLAQRGFPFAAVAAVAFISLFAWLAGSLAQRLRCSAPTQP